jgi:zinc transporter 9
VHVALATNSGLLVAKLAVWGASGSSALLAEAVHSAADLFNQYLLRVGIRASQRQADGLHPYGYHRDRFIWALISGVGVFCVGAGVSIVHGLHALAEPAPVEHLGPALAVMGVSAVAESGSFAVAAQAVRAGARQQGVSFWEYLRSGRDPTTTAVLAEDGAAIVGVAIAGACMGAAVWTGNPAWDAAGSILVGGLLGGVAVGLIQKNRQLLLGRSMPPAEARRVLEHLTRDPVVRTVIDAKTEEIGPGLFRFKAEVSFSGPTVVDRYLLRARGVGGPRAAVRAAARGGDPRAFEAALRAYGQGLVDALALEVDRIEAEIQMIDPRILHVDLENDRKPIGEALMERPAPRHEW